MLDNSLQVWDYPLVRVRSRVQSSLAAPLNHHTKQWFSGTPQKTEDVISMQNDARTCATASHETGTKVIWDYYRAEIERKLAGDPNLLAKCLESYAANKDLSDVAFQYSQGRMSAVDQYVLASMCAGINSGSLAALVVPVSGGPKADADAAGNSAILETLPPPFGATFDTSTNAGGVNGDGLFWWDEPVRFSFAGEAVWIEPRALVLEVGLVDSCKVARCIHRERGIGIARWPYGSPDIWLLLPKCAIPRDFSGLGSASYQNKGCFSPEPVNRRCA